MEKMELRNKKMLIIYQITIRHVSNFNRNGDHIIFYF